MGFSTYQWLNNHPTMKSFAFVLLIAAAVAEPEAKADPEAGYLYGGYGGYGLGYGGYARGYGLGGYYGGYGGYGLGLGYRSYGYGLRHFGKRSADAEPAAEPEAEPGYPYGGYGGYGLGYGGYYGRGYGGYGLGLGYRSYGYGHGLRSYGYAGHYLGKRAADAEPEADAGYLYGGYGLGYGGYGYGRGYGYGLGYARGYGYGLGGYRGTAMVCGEDKHSAHFPLRAFIQKLPITNYLFKDFSSTDKESVPHICGE